MSRCTTDDDESGLLLSLAQDTAVQIISGSSPGSAESPWIGDTEYLALSDNTVCHHVYPELRWGHLSLLSAADINSSS